MEQSVQEQPKQAASFSFNSAPGKFLSFLHGVNERTVTLTAVTIAVAWVPAAVLSAFRGGAALLSFFTDYATQSRFLIILPVLILAAPNVNKRLCLVAHHFETFIPQTQLARFHTNWASFERLRDSRITQAIILLVTYGTIVWLSEHVGPESSAVLPWWKEGGGGFRWASLAGTWVMFISYPILIYFTLLWLWRQLLWTRFMRSTARLDLRLIAAHPDGLGGIGLIESAFRGQRPFSFCLGTGLAGGVANRVLRHGEALSSFGYDAAFLVGAVLLVCVAPYFVFTPKLMQMRRRGLLRYGEFACFVGEQFEKKWLKQPGAFNQDVITASDFSATNNLYGIVRNIDDIRMVPVGRFDFYAVLVVAFVPAIPVVLGSIPFDVLAHGAIKMLF
jgi:hypothetical protein